MAACRRREVALRRGAQPEHVRYLADLDLLRDALLRAVLRAVLLLVAAAFLGPGFRLLTVDDFDFVAEVRRPAGRLADDAPMLLLWPRADERERVPDFIRFVAILSLLSRQRWASSPVRE